MQDYRTGIGYDFHRLKSGLALMLGGVKILYSKGSLGHSDGDVLLHALTDALLGAAAAGDIGTLFPDNDPQWKGASSSVFVKKACQVVKKKKFRIHFVDAVILAEKPKLQPYFLEIRNSIAKLLGVALAHVSVKAKTAEGVGSIGQGAGLAAFASVTLVRIM